MNFTKVIKKQEQTLLSLQHSHLRILSQIEMNQLN